MTHCLTNQYFGALPPPPNLLLNKKLHFFISVKKSQNFILLLLFNIYLFNTKVREVIMWVGFLLTGDVVLCTANQSAEAPVPRGLRPDQIFGPQLWKSQGYFGKYSIPYLQIFFDSCKFYENGVKLSIVCLQKPILKVFNSIHYTVQNFCDIFVPRVSEHENCKNYM